MTSFSFQVPRSEDATVLWRTWVGVFPCFCFWFLFSFFFSKKNEEEKEETSFLPREKIVLINIIATFGWAAPSHALKPQGLMCLLEASWKSASGPQRPPLSTHTLLWHSPAQEPSTSPPQNSELRIKASPTPLPLAFQIQPPRVPSINHALYPPGWPKACHQRTHHPAMANPSLAPFHPRKEQFLEPKAT